MWYLVLAFGLMATVFRGQSVARLIAARAAASKSNETVANSTEVAKTEDPIYFQLSYGLKTLNDGFAFTFLWAVVITAKCFGTFVASRLNDLEKQKRVVGLDNGVDSGLELISNARKLKQIIGSMFGQVILHTCTLTLVMFGSTPTRLMAKGFKLGIKLLTVAILLIFGAMWATACEFHAKVTDATKQWIYSYQDKEKSRCLSPEDRVKLVQVELQLDGDPIGVSCRFFTVTYCFMGSVSLEYVGKLR